MPFDTLPDPNDKMDTGQPNTYTNNYAGSAATGTQIPSFS